MLDMCQCIQVLWVKIFESQQWWLRIEFFPSRCCGDRANKFLDLSLNRPREYRSYSIVWLECGLQGAVPLYGFGSAWNLDKPMTWSANVPGIFCYGLHFAKQWLLFPTNRKGLLDTRQWAKRKSIELSNDPKQLKLHADAHTRSWVRQSNMHLCITEFLQLIFPLDPPRQEKTTAHIPRQPFYTARSIIQESYTLLLLCDGMTLSRSPMGFMSASLIKS